MDRSKARRAGTELAHDTASASARRHWKAWQTLGILLLAVGLTWTLTIGADDAPPLASSLYGTVTVDGGPVAPGTEVVAEIDGVAFETSEVFAGPEGSGYRLDVPGDRLETPEREGGRSGETIRILVGGAEVPESLAWSEGTYRRLDLSATAGPDLAVTLDDGVETAARGDALTWTFEVSNHGPSDSNAVVLRSTMPTYVALVSASDGGFVESGSETAGLALRWPDFALLAGESRTLSVEGRVLRSAPLDVTQLVHTARVSGDGTQGVDPVPGNDQATDTNTLDTLDALPDLVLGYDNLVFEPPFLANATPEAGDPVRVEVTVRNAGPGTAYEVPVVVYDDLPEAGGSERFSTLIDMLAPGANHRVSFDWTAEEGVGSFVAVADPDATLLELDTLNNRVERVVTVAGDLGPNLQVAVADLSGLSHSQLDLGLAGTAELTISNLGDATANGPIGLRLFEDLDGDATFDPGEPVLATPTLAGDLAAGVSTPLSVALAGTTAFHHPLVIVEVDPTNTVQETREDDNVAALFGDCPLPPVAPSLQPLTEWHAAGYEIEVAPTVAQLSDDNGDGAIDSRDTPDVVFLSSDGGGRLVVALSGLDGSRLWAFRGSNEAPLPFPIGHLAAADLDADGVVELVVPLRNGRLACLENDGTLRWISDPLAGPSERFAGSVAVGDLSGDGAPEIAVGRTVLDRFGRVLAVGSADRARNVNYYGPFGVVTVPGVDDYPNSVIADVDLDGRAELVAGDTLYRFENGQLTVVWNHNAPDNLMRDGWSAVGQLDGDPQAEIVYVSSGQILILNHDGSTRAGRRLISNFIPFGTPTYWGGPPTVSDLDGDGIAEVLVAGASELVAMAANLGTLWRLPVGPDFGGINSVTAFDLDGDGNREVLYLDETTFYLVDGRNGQVRYSRPNTSKTASEHPVVADIDGDGRAEILLPSNTSFGGDTSTRGLHVLGHPGWNGARGLWTQYGFDERGVLADGTVVFPAAVPDRRFRTQRELAPPQDFLPNLTVALPRVGAPAVEGIPITLRVGNGGRGALGPGTVVRLYAVANLGDDPSTGELAAELVLDRGLRPGAWRDETVLWRRSTAGGQPVAVVVDEPGAVEECDEADNQLDFVLDAVLLGDLALDAASAPATTHGGALVPVTVDLRNTGLAVTGESTLRLRLAGVAAGEATIPSLEPGASTQVVVRWDSRGQALGPVSLEVLADADDVLLESDEGNNAGSVDLELVAATAPDLAVEGLRSEPATVDEGRIVTLVATVVNRGSELAADSTVAFEVNTAELGRRAISAPMAAGESREINLPFDTLGRSGRLELDAVADPDGALAELDESNNRAEATLDVVGATVSLTVTADRISVPAETDVALDVRANNSADPVELRLLVQVLDVFGTPLAVLSEQTLTLASGPTPFPRVWNSGMTAPGPVTVMAELWDDAAAGGPTVRARGIASLSIPPDLSADAALTTDRTTYAPNTTVEMMGGVTNSSANTDFEQLTLVTRVVVAGAGGAELHRNETPLPVLAQGDTLTVSDSWPVAMSAPGDYAAQVELRDREGLLLAFAEAPFVVLDSAQTGDGLVGLLEVQPAGGVGAGAPVVAAWEVGNEGNNDFTDLPLRVDLVDVTTDTVVVFQAVRIDLDQGSTRDGGFAFDTLALPEGFYLANLVATVPEGEVPLDSESFTIGRGVSVSDVETLEGDSGSHTVLFDVTLSSAADHDVSIRVATRDSSAVDGEDYLGNSEVLTFAPGEVAKTFAVEVLGDLDVETDETFLVVLDEPASVFLGDAQGIATLLDEEGCASPNLVRNPGAEEVADDGADETPEWTALGGPWRRRFADPNPIAGLASWSSGTGGELIQTVDLTAYASRIDAGTQDFAFAAFLRVADPGAADTATVHAEYQDADGNILAHYQSPGDASVEGWQALCDERTAPVGTRKVVIRLTGGASEAFFDRVSLHSLGVRTVSVNDVSVVEGDAGTIDAPFELTLSCAATLPVLVDLRTEGGTATADGDFVGRLETVTVPAGATTLSVPVTVLGDTTDEPDEGFTLWLDGAVEALVLDGQGEALLLDDDGPSALSVADVEVLEGEDGTTDAVFEVELSQASGQTVRVDFATSDGTASGSGAAADYQGDSGTLVFAPGETLQMVTIPVVGDRVGEADETFTLTLSNPQFATLLDGNAEATIRDDDVVELAIDNPLVLEGDPGQSPQLVFTVSLSIPSERDVSVAYASEDIDALAGVDYNAAAGSLLFPPGFTEQTVSVAVIPDLDREPHETLRMVLSAPVNAVLALPEGIGTLFDDDGILVSIADVQFTETDGLANARVPVTLNKATADEVSVDVATVAGTAFESDDFQAVSQTLTFAPGVARIDVTVPIVGDTVEEGVETLSLVASNPMGGAVILDGEGIVTVVDDDGWNLQGVSNLTDIPGCVVVTPPGRRHTGSAWKTDKIDLADSFDKTFRVFLGNSPSGADGMVFALQNASPTVIGGGGLGFGYQYINPSVGVEMDTSRNGGDPWYDHLAIEINGAVNHNGVAPVPIFPDLAWVEDGQEHLLRVIWNAEHDTYEVDFDGLERIFYRRDLVATPFGGQNEVWWGFTASTWGTFSLQYACEVARCDDGADPAVSVGNVRETEGEDGETREFAFPVTLSCPSDQVTTIDFTAVSDSAIAGLDFVETSGTVTFQPGETSTYARITVLGDEIPEGDREAFDVVLSNPQGLSILNGTGRGEILDDDVTWHTNGTANTTSIDQCVHLTPDQWWTAGSAWNDQQHDLREHFDQTFTVFLGHNDSGADGISFTFQNVGTTALGGNGAAMGFFPLDPVLSIEIDTYSNGSYSNDPWYDHIAVNGPGSLSGDLHLGVQASPTRTNIEDSFRTAFRVLWNAEHQQLDVHFEDSERLTLDHDMINARFGGDPTVWWGFTGGTGRPNLQYFCPLANCYESTANPEFQVGDLKAVEGASGITEFHLALTLVCPSVETVSVDWETVALAAGPGIAVPGEDFLPESGTITFQPGETSKSIVLSIVGDSIEEADEKFQVRLSNPTLGSIRYPLGDVTILSDDLVANPISSALVEGNGANYDVTVGVELATPFDKTVAIDWATADGEALSGLDYQTRSGRLTFSPGQTRADLVLQIVGDTVEEPDEVFYLDFTSTNPRVLASRSPITILDDDGCPSPDLLVNGSGEQWADGTFVGWTEVVGTDWRQAQSDGAIDGSWYFWPGNVALGELAQDVDVASFARRIDAGLQRFVFEGWMRSAPPEGVGDLPRMVLEYRDAAGQVLESYDTGEQWSRYSWLRVSDLRAAPVGTRSLRLRLIGRNQGTNASNDARFDRLTLRALDVPALTIADVEVGEGEVGQRDAVFPVALSCQSDLTVSVAYFTQDGTATAGSDYLAQSGVLELAPGQTSATIAVPVLGDTLDEGAETFDLVLADPQGAGLGRTRAVGTILPDEVMLSISSVTELELDSGQRDFVFTFTLSKASPLTVTVDYETGGGSATGSAGATPGTDYIAQQGTLVFSPGMTSQTLAVPVFGDTEVEPDEVFRVNLSNAVNAALADTRGYGTILHDDIGVSIGDGSAIEGGVGETTTLELAVRLSELATQTITVDWTTVDGPPSTATAGDDYTAASGSLTFAPGVHEQILTFDVLGDDEIELGETLIVRLSNVVGATLVDDEGVGFLADDDECPSPNLLVNPAAEEAPVGGNLPGWTAVGSPWQRINWPPLFEGGYFFQAPGLGEKELYQDVDVSAFAPFVDAGTQRFTFVGYVRSGTEDPSDPARIVVEYRDHAGMILDAWDSGEVFHLNSWKRLADLRQAPVGSRTVRVRLLTRRIGGPNADGYFDALALRSVGTPTLAVDDFQVFETDTESTFAPLLVDIGCVSERAISFDVLTVGETASAVDDFVPVDERLTIDAGTTTVERPIEVLGDFRNELRETFRVEFSNPEEVVILDPDVTIAIRDADPGSAPIPAVEKVYSLDEDFDLGSLVSVHHDPPTHDQLQLGTEGSTFPFLWVALSARGSIAKIDVETGTVLGEYRTNPDDHDMSNPSRTTVALDGSVWVANRDDSSVTHIGLPELSQCIDKNGNGVIDTSAGYGDVLPWPNPGRVDSNGGTSSAEDECVLHYTPTTSVGTRHVSVTRDNDVWVSGIGSREFDLIDGATGEILRTETGFDCGGYGGLIDGNGIIWSVTSGGGLLRWDPDVIPATTQSKRCIPYLEPYGVAIDTDGWVWVSSLFNDRVRRVSPDGNTVQGPFGHGDTHSQGLAVDSDDRVWISTSLLSNGRNRIGQLAKDGRFIGYVDNVPHGSTGVAVDANGKIWTANYQASNASRIDPNAGPIGSDGVTPRGAVDLVVPLPGAIPYNYSDMTGFVALASTAPQGTWCMIQDAGVDGAPWGTITWNNEPEGFVPDGGSIVGEVRAADSVPGLGGELWTEITSGTPFEVMGRFLQVCVTLRPDADGTSPVLSDLEVTVDGTARLSVGDLTVVEGDPAASSDPYAQDTVVVEVPVTLEAPSLIETRVTVDVVADSASDGSDFLSSTGTLVIPAGMVEATVPVTLVRDQLAEGTESFKVLLSEPDGGTVVDGEGVVTITDDDVPTLALSKVDALSFDARGDGDANPADRLLYTVTVENPGTGSALGIQFSDAVPLHTTVVPGTATADQGTVTSDGSAGTVGAELGDLAPGESTTVRFEVVVDRPLPLEVTAVANQAVASAAGVGPTASDDPDTPEAGDPTVTPIVPLSGETTECTVEGFDTLPADWALTFLGDADGGTVEAVAGQVQVTGNGTSLYHSGDHAAYYYREVSVLEDFRIEVDVTGFPVDEGGQVRKAALMLRGGLGTFDPRVMVTFVPHMPGATQDDPDTMAIQFDARQLPGDGGVEIGNTVFDVPLPSRLAVEKRGSIYTVYHSVDGGTTWIRPNDATFNASVELDLAGGTSGETLYAGLAVSSYDADTLMTASFDTFAVCGPNDDPPVDPPEPPVCDTDVPLDVIYLLDVSGSMTAAYPGAGSKLEAARDALLALDGELAAQADSRVALVTYAGFRTVEENLAGVAEVRSSLTGDLASIDTLLLELDPTGIDPGTPTAAALALDQVRELLAGYDFTDRQPVVVWLTDGIPNIDDEGRGPDVYGLEALQDISLLRPDGTFRTWGEVAWLGEFNGDLGTFDGEPLADTMRALEEMTLSVPGLKVYGVALQGDGVDLGTFNEDLLEYAAWFGSGRALSATETPALLAAIHALATDLDCGGDGTAELGGRLWHDANQDGVFDDGTAGPVETGLAGVTIDLFDGAGFSLDSTVTDGLGDYRFETLAEGTFTLRVDASTLPSGLTVPTGDPDGIETVDLATVTLADGESRLDADFGYTLVDTGPPSTLCEDDPFDDPALDPVWQLAELGNADQAAVEIESDGSSGRLLLTGDGTSLFHGDDNAAFLHQSVSGDFRAEVLVTDFPVDQGGAVRKACLMARTGLAPRDPRVMACFIPHLPNPPTTALQFDVRHADGTAEELATLITDPVLPIGLAVERRGDVFTVYYSRDGGTSWIRAAGQLGSVEVAVGETVEVGLAVASYDSAITMTAAFDDFRLCRPNAVAAYSPLAPPVCDPNQAVDAVFLLDRSGSMRTGFAGAGSRLEAAQNALRGLGDALALRADGSRAALVSLMGRATPELTVSDGAEVHVGLTTDLAAVDAGLASLDVGGIDGNAGAPASIAIDRVRELLLERDDTSRRPVVVWLLDGHPTIDGVGRGPGEYAPGELEAIRLGDGAGGWLPWSTVAWMGGFNGGSLTYDGEPMANTMLALEALADALPETRIYGIAIQGDGLLAAPFHTDLLAYGEFVTGGHLPEGTGGPRSATDADALVAVLLEVAASLSCPVP